MNRTILIIAGVFGASSLLLVDSAVKGTALLVLAAVAALILRRDSAATRHLVWLLAIVAMLAVPVLSAMLPQWRVLPKWASALPARPVVAASPPSIARPSVGAVEVTGYAGSDEVGSPSAAPHSPAAALPDSPPALVTPRPVPAPAVRSWHWLNALPLVWAIGFCVLVLRLMAARWMLWNTERQGTVVWPSRQPADATYDALVTELQAASMQLGICRPVTLLIHPEKTIPIVWGILRCRLLLPITARDWSGEQLRSVLLHELPDGYGTWAAAWVRGSSVLWVLQKGKVRSIDFTNPALVKETTLEEPATIEKVPKPILDALHAELDVPATPKPARDTPRPAAETPK